LFPGDKLLLLGTEEQIAASRAFLLEDRGAQPVEDTFRDLAVELVQIPRGSRANGKTLRELNWPRILGVQVVGHENEKKRILTPSATQKVEDGDRILVLGTPQQVASLRSWLLPPAAPAASPSAESTEGKPESMPS
jgi:CPA2 family monovalent cation:H+ antiporter-2